MTSSIRKGMLLGLITAILFCVWVSIIYLSDGPRSFGKLGTTYRATVVMYILVGTVTGAVIGALLPFTGSRVGAYAVGGVASIPIVLGILIQNAGLPGNWDIEQWTLAPVIWLIAALAIGNETRRRSGPSAQAPDGGGRGSE